MLDTRLLPLLRGLLALGLRGLRRGHLLCRLLPSLLSERSTTGTAEHISGSYRSTTTRAVHFVSPLRAPPTPRHTPISIKTTVHASATARRPLSVIRRRGPSVRPEAMTHRLACRPHGSHASALPRARCDRGSGHHVRASVDLAAGSHLRVSLSTVWRFRDAGRRRPEWTAPCARIVVLYRRTHHPCSEGVDSPWPTSSASC